MRLQVHRHVACTAFAHSRPVALPPTPHTHTRTVVPPGYFVTGAALLPCANGTYRTSWLLTTDPQAALCTACGTGIASEPRDLDENPLVANGSLARATSASCCECVAWLGLGLLDGAGHSHSHCPDSDTHWLLSC
jgi:hypothetical protein